MAHGSSKFVNNMPLKKNRRIHDCMYKCTVNYCGQKSLYKVQMMVSFFPACDNRLMRLYTGTLISELFSFRSDRWIWSLHDNNGMRIRCKIPKFPNYLVYKYGKIFKRKEACILQQNSIGLNTASINGYGKYFRVGVGGMWQTFEQ